MATISGASNEKVYSIQKWGGLNEHPDGDTRLKLGEASVMSNWKVTRDGNLKRRPGTELIYNLRQDGSGEYAREPVTGLWSGIVKGKQVILAACEDHIYSLYDDDSGSFQKVEVGECETDKGVFFFPFNGIVYILNGNEYYQYDGSTFELVEGYRPLVAITISPLIEGGGQESGTTTSEYINRLNGKRRVWLSPDGDGSTFQMPETKLESIDYVKNLSTNLEVTGWTYDLELGQVTFNIPPQEGTDTYEVGYSVGKTYRSQIVKHRFAELFSGTTYTRVFLYGNGPNQTVSSGMDQDGLPRADYFPDQEEHPP